MSLDKFLSGNASKKKKKVSKPLSKKESENSDGTNFSDSTNHPITLQEKHVEPDLNSELANPPLADTPISSDPVSTSNSTFSTNEHIFVSEFQNKTTNELFQIIVDIVHASPAYVRNKNLLAKYLHDNKGEYNSELLADQLEISYNELLVLIAEIKRDLP